MTPISLIRHGEMYHAIGADALRVSAILETQILRGVEKGSTPCTRIHKRLLPWALDTLRARNLTIEVVEE